MKKTAAHSKRKRIIAVTATVVVLLLFLVVIVLGFHKLAYYDDAADQAGLARIRESLIIAANSLKKVAPVEPKTGNIYFPESKLLLPNPKTVTLYTYAHDDGGLRISTDPVPGNEALYGARNQEELFAAVPKLQACSRGISLVYQPLSTSDTANELRAKVQLSSGRIVYIYLEKACPELKQVADSLENIQAF